MDAMRAAHAPRFPATLAARDGTTGFPPSKGTRRAASVANVEP